MAKTFPVVRVCHVCGKENVFNRERQTGEMSWPDLDTRPSGKQRESLQFWIQCCARCGYCAEDISEYVPGAAGIVQSEPYKTLRNSDQYPELAKRFLCAALVHERCGHVPQAAWSTIHAAWVCDDAGNDEGAKALRKRAAELVRQFTSPAEDPADKLLDDLVLVDLLRRSGQFEDAHKINQLLETKAAGPVTRQLLAYEEQLIMKEDTGPHSMGEAVDRKGKPSG